MAFRVANFSRYVRSSKIRHQSSNIRRFGSSMLNTLLGTVESDILEWSSEQIGLDI